MKKIANNWSKEDQFYWVNSISKYVVREIGRTERQEWVILDDKGMMLSCEWRSNKQDCFIEADRIYKEELFQAHA